MEWVLAILAIIAAVGSAAGAKVTADAQEKTANYNADVNKKNAESAAQQAAFDAEQIRSKNKKMLGAQRAAYAASGLDNSGSAIDVQQDSAAQGEMDALVAIYTGATSANSSIARARLNSMEGKSARQAGRIGVTTSLLSGATSATGYASNPKLN